MSATTKSAPKLFAQVCLRFGLPEPKPEYKFHPARRWRIDWYFEANGRKVALEVEGGVWRGGRHTNPAGFMKDMEKYNEMARMGIILLRTTPGNLLKTETFELVKRTLYGSTN